MAEWLSIIGLGEDGPDGLSPASRQALAGAETVFGGPQHLALIDHPDKRPWPVPFSIAPALALRGRKVAVLASGNPFWQGAGSVLAEALELGEWRAYPAPSVVSLAAARLGWRLEGVTALGLHAAPIATLRAYLAPGRRLIVTLRDGAAVAELAGWLAAEGFGASRLWPMEALRGPHERIRDSHADAPLPGAISPLVTVAIAVAEGGAVVPHASGIADGFFAHDGQISKRLERTAPILVGPALAGGRLR